MQNATAAPARKRRTQVRRITVTAMLAAVATVLMYVEFSVPFMPEFVKLDISELPGMLAAFSFGPVAGVCVCLIKNTLHLLVTTTGGVGELSNFLLGACLVVPAGLIYQLRKSRGGALVGALIGSAVMALVSIPLNYYLTYPIYANFMPVDVIVGMYQAIRPTVNGLLSCLITFNAPFNFLKGVIATAICFAIYKPLSPILHGKR